MNELTIILYQLARILATLKAIKKGPVAIAKRAARKEALKKVGKQTQ